MILTDTQQMIQDTFRQFAQSELAPFAGDWDVHKTFPQTALAKLGELGAMGVLVPEGFGGSGLDYLSLVLILEEIAAGDGATSTIVSVQNSLVNAIILRYGSEAQKKSWLPSLATGRMLGCFCLTEPEVGSDAGAISTRATETAEGFVINGVKQFITTGQQADVAIVIAVTDPSAGKKGLSCFLVPTATAGYRVAGIENKLGQNASDTAQIVFENCCVSASALIGSRGEGYKIALSNLEAGRMGIAAQSVGMARSALEAALRYAKERKSFGKPIIEHQAVNFRLADMAMQIAVARQMVWHAASLKDAGKPSLTEASMAKLFASEMAERVCSDAIQIHGGYGYVRDFPVERIYRDVRVCQIYEGTSDIQRMVIARSFL